MHGLVGGVEHHDRPLQPDGEEDDLVDRFDAREK